MSFKHYENVHLTTSYYIGVEARYPATIIDYNETNNTYRVKVEIGGAVFTDESGFGHVGGGLHSMWVSVDSLEKK